jgi:hypothetical protein
MKKLILLAGVLLIVSCQKEKKQINGNHPSTSSNDVVSAVDNITEGYLSSQPSLNLAKPPKWLSIVGADLGGALIGAGTGFTIGNGIDPNGNGGQWGALGGGIAGGAAASIEKGEELGLNGGPSGGTTLTANAANMYDIAGLIHYDIIASAYRTPSSVFVNDQLDYSLYFDFSFDVMKANNLDMDRYKQYFSVRFLQETTADALGEQSLTGLVNSSKFLDATEKSILTSYFHAFNKTTESASFGPYSVQVENSIVNSSLPDRSKIILLITMATARHGVAYWD